MTNHLKFSHKILLAASLVVIAAFSLFTLYNDYLQRQAIRANLENYLHEMGEVTAGTIQNWLSGRILLVENTAQTLARDAASGNVGGLLEQRALASSFAFSYLGGADGAFTMRPDSQMPDGYDPRTRPWYKDAVAAGGTTLTEPYVDAATGGLIITIATPARPAGVVGGDLSLSTLVDIINSLDFDGMGHAFLVNGAGKILVHPDKSLVMKSLKDVFPQNTPRIGSDLGEVEVDGQTRLLTFAPIAGLPSVTWYLGLSIDKGKAYAMLDEFRASAIVATLIAVVLIILLLSMLIRVLMQPLHLMGKAMQDIAQGEGDLTKRLAIQSDDEFGALAKAFNRFVERIHASIREVSSATLQVNEVAQLVLNASNSSLHNSDEQASRTNSVAAAINQLGAAAQEIARNAADASAQASDARGQAEDGRQVVEQTIRAMNDLSSKISGSCSHIETLNGKTVNIGQILEVIKSISQQTNLLALNAAIEAARAGEAGRGFAVVADEVRNLAHRTQESAQEIEQMIEELQIGSRESVTTMTESQRYSEESVEIANQAGERLSSVTQRIGEIDGMNQSVATATEEQTSVIESLNMDIIEINTLNQEGVENLQATLRACGDLEQQATRLKQLVGSFRI
ncbi:methyl-accepting chemotaxis protein [Pseudomonas lalucatii]|uniref:Methyl-accepting chemotaxis protein n=1 Tax=Pseudomonas lalucatii TaxID=1424203 RepID=A0ABS5PZD1_9PSED|nr:methyl-accepting chemotaxis protein [Pseudomonas lalucatii]MBS7661852.1 methyl-accepting chemotaxis protein [Pseudomonas lalucatii]MBS7726248.1 methyl-accepting chemotaxis protein [Pseudomonas lalucatii]